MEIRTKTCRSNAEFTGAYTRHLAELNNMVKMTPDMWETLNLYDACGREYYHLKKRIKGMKFSEFTLKKI